MSERPNVLLLVCDTARADGFSPYSPSKATPTVGQLASRGTAYPNAIAPSSWTMPSHASMFLGAPPRSVGLSRIPGGKGVLCKPVIESQQDLWLPEVLRRSGYRTAGVSANVWIAARNGFATGFDAFHEISGHRVGRMTQGGIRTRAKWYLDALRARADDGASAIEALLDTWISERGTGRSAEPFFWFVNLLECHSPYLPPRPYNDVGPVQRVLAAEDARRWQSFDGVLRAAATGHGPPPRSAARMRHLYERSIAQMDDWLARVLGSLDRARVLDDTVVIVTSDHGENFGENGLVGHAGSLDDRLLRIPLVIAGPRVTRAPDEVVSLDELPRIVAAVAGLEDHPWEASPHPGVAIAQYDGPLRPGHPNMRVLDEWGATAEGRMRLTLRFSAATDGTMKVVRSEAGDRVYDLVRDPLEVTGAALSGSDDGRVEALVRALDRASTDAWDPDFTSEDQPEDVDDAEREAIEERMKLLGYL